MATPTIFEVIAADMRMMDEVIRKRLHSEVVLVRSLSDYIINSGGKRLRPALLLMCAGALGYRGTAHIELAAVVEFIHTATLLHDDVVDESDLRRGRQTANAVFGNAAPVLVGDFLYSRAFQMMVSINNTRVMQVLADTTNIIAEGEVLQLLNCHDADITVERYLAVVRYKTAQLFEASARLAAILAQVDVELENAIAAYGMHLGTAFQIVDDVLDYTSDAETLGKQLGDDLAEGKPTLPLIFAMQDGSEQQAAIVKNAIERGGREDFTAVLDVIHATGALEKSRQCAKVESEYAAHAIINITSSQYREALLELASFAVERSH